MTQDDKYIIYADPTKDFFIDMLTKDIPLIRAIIDLIDNCIDGAIRIRGNNNFDGLWVDIHLDKNTFHIKDNCGGIPLKVAQNYAFRFGRPPGAETTLNSVGLFGVGMKRAIFKMGNAFIVESKTEANHFLVKEDIPEWSKKTDNWNFEFNDAAPNETELIENGTRIQVDRLHESIGQQFALQNFITELTGQIEAAQQISLAKGLTIQLNGRNLSAQQSLLLKSDEIQPGYSLVEPKAYPGVSVRIYTGVYERNYEKGGWYLFCNSRLVLYADQSPTTGWDEAGALPKYHPDFAYARGYVYFESEDASLLPWNTTKTGVDADSPLYKTVRQQMVSLMRPVTRWLRSNLAAEQSEEGDNGKLHQALLSAKPVSVRNLAWKDDISFEAPQFVKPEGPGLTNIQYKMPVELVNKLKECLGVSTNSEVGRETFEYYNKWECSE